MKQLDLFENKVNKPSKSLENEFDWAKAFPQLCDESGFFQGFDVIVGNPPYIPLKKLPELKEVKEEYQTFDSNTDIYVLFIEKALQILKNEGKLGFITSNKWLRAAYGENLREFLLKNTSIDKLIDFDGLKVFDEATVDTSVITLTKHQNGKQPIQAVRLDKTFDLEKESIATYFEKYKVELKNLTKEIWNLTSEKENAIKQKIESKGKPLKEWNIKIYRGITTGLNEAFVIDEKTKNDLIRQDAKNAEIIKPLLRGRDIKQYDYEFSDLWLINTHNGLKSENIHPINVKKDFLSIYKHLLKFVPKIKNRKDKGEHWSNLRNCAYFKEFEKEKIVFTKASQTKSFAYDNKGFYLQNTSYILVGENIKYLLALLNSKLISYAFMNFYQSGGIEGEITVQGINEIPIPPITNKNKKEVKRIELLVNQILAKKQANKNSTILEEKTEIDKIIYRLYELTDDEITVIEK